MPSKQPRLETAAHADKHPGQAGMPSLKMPAFSFSPCAEAEAHSPVWLLCARTIGCGGGVERTGDDSASLDENALSPPSSPSSSSSNATAPLPLPLPPLVGLWAAAVPAVEAPGITAGSGFLRGRPTPDGGAPDSLRSLVRWRVHHVETCAEEHGAERGRETCRRPGRERRVGRRKAEVIRKCSKNGSEDGDGTHLFVGEREPLSDCMHLGFGESLVLGKLGV